MEEAALVLVPMFGETGKGAKEDPQAPALLTQLPSAPRPWTPQPLSPGCLCQPTEVKCELQMQAAYGIFNVLVATFIQ